MTGLSFDEILVHNNLLQAIKEYNAAIAKESIIHLENQRCTKGFTKEMEDKARYESTRTEKNLRVAALAWGTINTQRVDIDS